MFLTDVFLIEQLTVLNEGKKGNGPMRVRGIFQRADEANNNGRIYPKTILEGQVKKLQDKICDRTLCGELDHPQNDSVRLSNASHLITKLYMQGPEVIGEAEILNTPAGMTAKALIEGGVKIGISSRGTGTISENATGAKVVNEDFNMVTFDLVADPSTRAAYPGMCESTESELISNTMDKFGKEKNFLTMLESRLNESAIDAISSAGAASQGKGKKHLRGIAGGAIGGGIGLGAAKVRSSYHNKKYGVGDPDNPSTDDYGRTAKEKAHSAFTHAVAGTAGAAFSARVTDRINARANALKAKEKEAALKAKEKEAHPEKTASDDKEAKVKANKDKKSVYLGRIAVGARAAAKAKRRATLQVGIDANKAKKAKRDAERTTLSKTLAVSTGGKSTEDKFAAATDRTVPKTGPQRKRARQKAGTATGKALNNLRNSNTPLTGQLGDPTKITFPNKKDK